MNNLIYPITKSSVFLFSSPSGLSISIVESLLANHCRIIIHSSKKSKWKKQLSHLKDNPNIIFCSEGETSDAYNPDYIICVCYAEENVDQIVGGSKKNISEAIDLALKHSANVFIVLPYIQHSNEEKSINLFANEIFKNHREKLGLVYVGETMGPRVNLFTHRPIKKLLYELVSNRKLSKPLASDDHIIFPTDVSLLSKQIVRNMFSFGGVGERKAFLSRGIVFNSYVKDIMSRFSRQEREEYGVKKPMRERGVVVEKIETNIEKATTQTIDWYKENFPERIKKVEEKKEKHTKARQEANKYKINVVSAFRSVEIQKRLKVMALVFIIILSPYVFYVFGTVFLFSTLEKIQNQQISSARKTLNVSTTMTNISQKEFEIFSNIPVLGSVFGSGQEKTELVQKSSKLLKKNIDLLVRSEALFKGFLSEDDYNFNEEWSSVKLLLNEIYEDLSFLENELNSGKSLVSTYYRQKFGKEELSILRNEILNYRKLVGHLDWVLGMKESRKYLVLFQDDSELRPTGGFINTVMIIEIRNGKIFSSAFHSTESLDSKLKGMVSPPELLRKYLSEDTWFLRDSNWDPDFPTSAKQAEWFISKEIDESVDGVIAVNSSVFTVEDKNVLNNVKDIEQLAVESLGVFKNNTQKQFIEFLMSSKKHLDEKNIQVYFYNNSLQDVISEQLWDGSVYSPDCVENCIVDMIGFVEANVGVNKVNEFVERRASIETTLKNQVVKNITTIEFFNSSPLDSSGKSKYEVFLRFLAPYNSIFSNIGVVDITGTRYVSPEIVNLRGRKEAGIYLEIPASQKTTVTFEFERGEVLKFDRQGEYRMIFRKQSGVPSYPVEIRHRVPENLVVNFSKPFSLTSLGYYRYNTLLARDYFSRLFW